MTNEEAMRICTDIGVHEGGMENWVMDNAWVKFAELVAAHEREECAKVCAEIADANKNTVILQGAANCCAASIRARSKA
jgi:hypothetical protein